MPVPTHAEDPNDLKNNDVSTTIGGEDTIPTGGLDNFIEIRRNGTYLTDKSILIERIMSDRRYKMFLFCRPRRFGKSVNLTMLDANYITISPIAINHIIVLTSNKINSHSCQFSFKELPLHAHQSTRFRHIVILIQRGEPGHLRRDRYAPGLPGFLHPLQ